jgi:hypothetical protein
MSDGYTDDPAAAQNDQWYVDPKEAASAAIAAAYEQHLGRTPSQQEINSHLGNQWANYNKPGFIQEQIGFIADSEEARARAQQPAAEDAPQQQQSSGGSSAPSANAPDPYKPFTEKFNAPTAPTDLMDQWGKEFSWDPTAAANSPEMAFRQAEALKAGQRSAAARGTVLNTGTQMALQDRAQGVASQFMGEDYDRALKSYGTNFDTFTTDKTRRSNEFSNTYNRASDEYKTQAGIWNTNESGRVGSETSNWLNGFNMDRTLDRDSVSDQQFLSSQGLTAALAMSNAGSQFGASGSNTIQNAGNSAAAGTVGSANAWSTGVGNVANTAGQLPLYAAYMRRG